jgi:hypothetical protein
MPSHWQIYNLRKFRPGVSSAVIGETPEVRADRTSEKGHT